MTLEAQRFCLHPKNAYESVAKYGIYFFFAIFCLKFFKIPLDTYIHTYIRIVSPTVINVRSVRRSRRNTRQHSDDACRKKKPASHGICSIVCSYAVADGKCKNLFAAANVTLKKDVGERAFLYGGVGAGMARSDFGEFNCKFDDAGVAQTGKIDFKAKWWFLLQAFAGAGVCLNENWSLTAGYRLRYLAEDVDGSKKWGGYRWDFKVKQNLLHAAEIGLTYQF